MVRENTAVREECLYNFYVSLSLSNVYLGTNGYLFKEALYFNKALKA
jgi:hypothetical protein